MLATPVPAVKSGLVMPPLAWVTAAVFLLVLALVVTRPVRISEAVPALAGAILLLAVGAVSPVHAGEALLSHWNLFLFFLGLMTIAAVADLAGVFDWLADRAAAYSGGSARRLFINVFLVGAVLSTFLSNDATALILTPVVYTLSTRLGLPARPYVFACAFIANTASFVLPVSNPINIVVLGAVPAPLGTYLAHLLPAAVAAVLLNLLLFLALFRRDLCGRIKPGGIGVVPAVKSHPSFFRAVCAWLVATAVVYVTGAAREWPLGVVATVSGLGLVGLAIAFGKLSGKKLARDISWSLFGFIAGMLVLVQAVEDTGLTAPLARLLEVGAGDAGGATIVSVAAAAIGANLINNLPATFVLTATIGHVGDAARQPVLAFGIIIGADLGPNLTVIGSLSTMLWLLILRRRNLEVTALDFMRVGLLVAPLLLAASAALLWLAER